jgi:hypothetical protein
VGRNRQQNVANSDARELAREAATAEVRRQRAVGEALDLKAALDAVRGGPLDITAAAAMAQGDLSRLTMVFWVQCMSVLTDRAQHAPDINAQVNAANMGAQRACDMARLIAEANDRVGTKPAPAAQAEVVDTLTPEEKTAFVRAHLKVAR